MTKARGRVLFIPVSGPRGMGEYARSLALASAASARWPQLEVHFAVSARAPYAQNMPFPATVLPSSPTFHTPEVQALIRDFRPTLVIFDNAGRTAQLRAAVRSGARVVYVSSRPRQRRKAFRIHWMRMLDEHWIAYPEFIAGALGWFERMKLSWIARPSVHFLDAVLPPPDPALSQTMMARYAVQPNEYVLVVPGGGTDHPGAEDAPRIVANAARRIAEGGVATILVGVTPDQTVSTLRTAPRMPMAMLGELIRGARVVVSNGGDTLLQTLACGRPCVAVPIAGDQAHRINACVQRGFALRAPLDEARLAEMTLTLFADEQQSAALVAKLAESGIRNGMDVALNSIARLALR